MENGSGIGNNMNDQWGIESFVCDGGAWEMGKLSVEDTRIQITRQGLKGRHEGEIVLVPQA